MFRAYAVDLDEIGSLIADERVEYNYDNADEEKINSSLGNILKADVNLLNGDELIECFFPSKCCHVFLCHSGLDKDRVKLFAQWLKDNFDIVSFIDSDLWGGVEQLKQEIEAGKKKTNDCFSYEISEHAHVMLCHALTKMIDYAECFVFLKSSNSSTSQQSSKKPGTFSPWIFYELLFFNKTKIMIPQKYKNFAKTACLSEARENLKIEMPVQMQTLYSISCTILDEWSNNYRKSRQDIMPIEMLYKILTTHIEE